MRRRIVSFLALEKMESSRITLFVLMTVVLCIVVHVLLRLLDVVRRGVQHARALKHFPGPAAHWFYGNIKQMLDSGDIMGYQAKQAAKYRLAYRFMLAPGRYQLRLIHPDCIKSVLASEPKDSFFYNFLEPWLGKGLLLSDGSRWKRNRRLLTPAFHFDALKPYVPVFCQSAEYLVIKWNDILKEKEEPLEVFHHISLMTLDSLMKCIFGYRGNCQAEDFSHPYVQGVCRLLELIAARARFLPYHNDFIYYLSWSGYQFRRACQAVHSYSRQVIQDRKRQASELKSYEKTYLDFLDILISAKDEDGNGLTDSEIQQEVDTFMFEGHDTTAGGISWCLYNLAAHPQYQTKCRDEINSLLGDRTDICWNDLNRLTFLTMCIKESLRITPVVPTIFRRITKDSTLPDGRIIPAGVCALVSIYECHHNPSVWENPEMYDPYRFTPENSAKRSSHSFIPFSAGPRNCIGQHFAMNEIKTALALLIKNFEFSVDESRPPVKVPAVTLKAKDGLWLKVKPVGK